MKRRGTVKTFLGTPVDEARRLLDVLGEIPAARGQMPELRAQFNAVFFQPDVPPYTAWAFIGELASLVEQYQPAAALPTPEPARPTAERRAREEARALQAQSASDIASTTEATRYAAMSNEQRAAFLAEADKLFDVLFQLSTKPKSEAQRALRTEVPSDRDLQQMARQLATAGGAAHEAAVMVRVGKARSALTAHMRKQSKLPAVDPEFAQMTLSELRQALRRVEHARPSDDYTRQRTLVARLSASIEKAEEVLTKLKARPNATFIPAKPSEFELTPEQVRARAAARAKEPEYAQWPTRDEVTEITRQLETLRAQRVREEGKLAAMTAAVEASPQYTRIVKLLALPLSELGQMLAGAEQVHESTSRGTDVPSRWTPKRPDAATRRTVGVKKFRERLLKQKAILDETGSLPASTEEAVQLRKAINARTARDAWERRLNELKAQLTPGSDVLDGVTLEDVQNELQRRQVVRAVEVFNRFKELHPNIREDVLRFVEWRNLAQAKGMSKENRAAFRGPEFKQLLSTLRAYLELADVLDQAAAAQAKLSPGLRPIAEQFRGLIASSRDEVEGAVQLETYGIGLRAGSLSTMLGEPVRATQRKKRDPRAEKKEQRPTAMFGASRQQVGLDLRGSFNYRQLDTFREPKGEGAFGVVLLRNFPYLESRLLPSAVVEDYDDGSSGASEGIKHYFANMLFFRYQYIAPYTQANADRVIKMHRGQRKKKIAELAEKFQKVGVRVFGKLLEEMKTQPATSTVKRVKDRPLAPALVAPSVTVTRDAGAPLDEQLRREREAWAARPRLEFHTPDMALNFDFAINYSELFQGIGFMAPGANDPELAAVNAQSLNRAPDMAPVEAAYQQAYVLPQGGVLYGEDPRALIYNSFWVVDPARGQLARLADVVASVAASKESAWGARERQMSEVVFDDPAYQGEPGPGNYKYAEFLRYTPEEVEAKQSGRSAVFTKNELLGFIVRGPAPVFVSNNRAIIYDWLTKDKSFFIMHVDPNLGLAAYEGVYNRSALNLVGDEEVGGQSRDALTATIGPSDLVSVAMAYRSVYPRPVAPGTKDWGRDILKTDAAARAAYAGLGVYDAIDTVHQLGADGWLRPEEMDRPPTVGFVARFVFADSPETGVEYKNLKFDDGEGGYEVRSIHRTTLRDLLRRVDAHTSLPSAPMDEDDEFNPGHAAQMSGRLKHYTGSELLADVYDEMVPRENSGDEGDGEDAEDAVLGEWDEDEDEVYRPESRYAEDPEPGDQHVVAPTDGSRDMLHDIADWNLLHADTGPVSIWLDGGDASGLYGVANFTERELDLFGIQLIWPYATPVYTLRDAPAKLGAYVAQYVNAQLHDEVAVYVFDALAQRYRALSTRLDAESREYVPGFVRAIDYINILFNGVPIDADGFEGRYEEQFAGMSLRDAYRAINTSLALLLNNGPDDGALSESFAYVTDMGVAQSGQDRFVSANKLVVTPGSLLDGSALTTMLPRDREYLERMLGGDTLAAVDETLVTFADDIADHIRKRSARSHSGQARYKPYIGSLLYYTQTGRASVVTNPNGKRVPKLHKVLPEPLRKLAQALLATAKTDDVSRGVSVPQAMQVYRFKRVLANEARTRLQTACALLESARNVRTMQTRARYLPREASFFDAVVLQLKDELFDNPMGNSFTQWADMDGDVDVDGTPGPVPAEQQAEMKRDLKVRLKARFDSLRKLMSVTPAAAAAATKKILEYTDLLWAILRFNGESAADVLRVVAQCEAVLADAVNVDDYDDICFAYLQPALERASRKIGAETEGRDSMGGMMPDPVELVVMLDETTGATRDMGRFVRWSGDAPVFGGDDGEGVEFASDVPDDVVVRDNARRRRRRPPAFQRPNAAKLSASDAKLAREMAVGPAYIIRQAVLAASSKTAGVRESFKQAVHKLVDAGLIYHDSATGIMLTEAGAQAERALLEKLLADKKARVKLVAGYYRLLREHEVRQNVSAQVTEQMRRLRPPAAPVTRDVEMSAPAQPAARPNPSGYPLSGDKTKKMRTVYNPKTRRVQTMMTVEYRPKIHNDTPGKGPKSREEQGLPKERTPKNGYRPRVYLELDSDGYPKMDTFYEKISKPIHAKARAALKWDADGRRQHRGDYVDERGRPATTYSDDEVIPVARGARSPRAKMKMSTQEPEPTPPPKGGGTRAPGAGGVVVPFGPPAAAGAASSRAPRAFQPGEAELLMKVLALSGMTWVEAPRARDVLAMLEREAPAILYGGTGQLIPANMVEQLRWLSDVDSAAELADVDHLSGGLYLHQLEQLRRGPSSQWFFTVARAVAAELVKRWTAAQAAGATAPLATITHLHGGKYEAPEERVARQTEERHVAAAAKADQREAHAAEVEEEYTAEMTRRAELVAIPDYPMEQSRAHKVIIRPRRDGVFIALDVPVSNPLKSMSKNPCLASGESIMGTPFSLDVFVGYGIGLVRAMVPATADEPALGLAWHVAPDDPKAATLLKLRRDAVEHGIVLDTKRRKAYAQAAKATHTEKMTMPWVRLPVAADGKTYRRPASELAPLVAWLTTSQGIIDVSVVNMRRLAALDGDARARLLRYVELTVEQLGGDAAPETVVAVAYGEASAPAAARLTRRGVGGQRKAVTQRTPGGAPVPPPQGRTPFTKL